MDDERIYFYKFFQEKCVYSITFTRFLIHLNKYKFNKLLRLLIINHRV